MELKPIPKNFLEVEEYKHVGQPCQFGCSSLPTLAGFECQWILHFYSCFEMKSMIDEQYHINQLYTSSKWQKLNLIEIIFN